MKRVTETLLLLLLVPGFGWAKSAQNNWDNLRQLAPGQKIRVVLSDAKSYTGHFQMVTDDGLVVRLGAAERTLRRQSILRVSAQGNAHRTRNALIGAAIGVGGGLAIAAGCYASYNNQGYTNNRCMEVIAPTGAAVGGGIGAGIGAMVSKSGWHEVYRAQ